MEYDLIHFLQTLLGGEVKGYLLVKPENTPYPAFTVESERTRGLSIHDNNGKPFNYLHEVQINVIGMKFSQVNQIQQTIVSALDGFSGLLGSHQVIDCRLDEAAALKSLTKNVEYILTFTLSTA